MTDSTGNTGPPPAAASEQPADQAGGRRLSEQILHYVVAFTAGNRLQKTIVAYLLMVLPTMIIIGSVGVVVISHVSPWAVLGGSAIGGGTSWAVTKGLQHRSKAAGDKPGNK